MATSTFEKGDLVRVTGTFTNSAGTAIDPSGVFFQALDPSDNATGPYEYGSDAELVKSSTGIYYVDLDADESGTWKYRFYSTGTGQAAQEGRFYVRPSEF